MDTLTPKKKRVIDAEVQRAFSQNPVFRKLSSADQAEILANTSAVVAQLAHSPSGPSGGDPYAMPQALPKGGPKGGGGNKAEAIHAGVDELKRFTSKEVDFPNFVAQLIQGTFHAIVTASIEQMKAYGDLVKSVAMSLNDFRDENVTANQGRDALISRYPDVFTLAKDQGGKVIVNQNGQAKLAILDGAGMGDLPDFQKDLGLSQPVDSLDDETIESTLVPAMRNSVALDRQRLLATTVLMGINRIVVTDGRINAKLRFSFSATDQFQSHAAQYDYANLGTSVQSQSQTETQEDSPNSSWGWNQGGYSSQYSAKSRYATGTYQYSSDPVIKVSSENVTDKAGEIQAAGMLSGEVNVNFKSETFPLEKFADANDLMFMQQAQVRGAGRATPATTPEAANAPPPTGNAPAPTSTTAHG